MGSETNSRHRRGMPSSGSEPVFGSNSAEADASIAANAFKEELALMRAAVDSTRGQWKTKPGGGLSMIDGRVTNLKDDTDMDVVFISGTQPLHPPDCGFEPEPPEKSIKAICEHVGNICLHFYPISTKNSQAGGANGVAGMSLEDEALHLLEYLTSIKTRELFNERETVQESRNRCLVLAGTGIGTTLIKACLLQSRVSVIPAQALIWTSVPGILLLNPITEETLHDWRKLRLSNLQASESVFTRITWQAVRDIELEYDEVLDKPVPFSVNLPPKADWGKVFSTMSSSTFKETLELQRLEQMFGTLRNWSSREPRTPFFAPPVNRDGKKLLSLDGGGLKGISSLMLLDAVMKQVQSLENRTGSDMPRPVDYFDLAAGTSTGGLIAILLFRLRMSIEDACQQYEKLGEEIFDPNPLPTMVKNIPYLGAATGWLVWPPLLVSRSFGRATYRAEPLENAVENLLNSSAVELGADTRLWDSRTRASRSGDDTGNTEDNRPRGAMFVCATLHDERRAIRFRSYRTESELQADQAPYNKDGNAEFNGTPIRVPENVLKDIEIKDAVRATSAAPTYFPHLELRGSKSKKASDKLDASDKSPKYAFWDGGVLNNNPVDQVWAARNDLDTRDVACLLSLGAGYADVRESGTNIVSLGKAVLDYASNTESKHKDFEQKWKALQASSANRPFLYARLNVPTHDKEIGLDSLKDMPALKEKTTAYLKTYTAKRTIKRLAVILHKQDPGVRLPTENTSPVNGNSNVSTVDAILEDAPGKPHITALKDASLGFDVMSLSLAVLGVKNKWWKWEAQSSEMGLTTADGEATPRFGLIYTSLHESDRSLKRRFVVASDLILPDPAIDVMLASKMFNE